MKPPVSKEAVFEGRTPRLVTARRMARSLLSPMPLIPVRNEVPESERRLPGVPGMANEAIKMAKELRRRVGSEALQEGVVVVPEDLPFTMAVMAKATEGVDSIVTDAEVSIVPPGGGHETDLIVHADELRDGLDRQAVMPVEDASVTILDMNNGRRYGIADFSPVERPDIRQVVGIATASLVEAPRLHVYRELTQV